MTERKRRNNPYPLGAEPEGDRIRFSFVSEDSDCGILLYDARSGKKIGKIPFEERDRIGNIFCKTVEGLEPDKTLYQFYRGEEILPDERGKRFVGVRGFGKEQNLSAWKTGFPAADYDWEKDRCPRIPYSRALFYGMHVRGFTKHASSGVLHRGTFAGIAEKIPYLQEIGVTTLELQPAYEFVEFSREETPALGAPGETAEKAPGEGKNNYWGYKKGFYYAPKSAYAAGEDAAAEFKDLVKALHQKGMELVMQFYFPAGVNRNEIADILRYWVLEYHVDGFHLIGERLPADLIAGDELLADSKLLWDGFEEMYRGTEVGRYPHLAEYNDGYLYDMRRFLKGDEAMLGSILRQMRHIPENMGRIHYLTNYYGFTLADMVSYDHKHNEDNGEENKDGNNYNCSWNCGEEGMTRSRRIRRLRMGQMKNAICLLLLTQSTPLIFMGDEFGNSQKGNNNPWCQDNPTAWLDWNAQKKNGELLEFWKQLVAFRKAHPILHPEKELRLMDYLSCGYPDLSYHGESAWSPRTDGPFRHVGLMLCGKYARIDRKREDDFLYIAMNMHWLSHKLALPKLPKGMRWEKAVATTEPLPEAGEENVRELLPRSIAVFISVREPEEKGDKRRAEPVREQRQESVKR